MYRKYLPLVVIATIILIGVGAWIAANNAAAPRSGFVVYRNTTYGFEIAYPKNLSPEPSFRQYYALSDRWRSQAPEGQPGVAVVAIPVFRVDNQDGIATGKPYPLYFTAEVRVGVSDAPAAVADCLKIDPGYSEQEHETVILNGTPFEKFEFGDAAMMQYVRGVSYRAVRDGKCYAIEQLKAGASYRDESMSAGIPDEQLDAYYAEAGEIAQSFKFIQ